MICMSIWDVGVFISGLCIRLKMHVIALHIAFVAVIPHWTGHVEKLDKRGDKGSPLLLVISSAATRAVELNRLVTMSMVS